MTFEIIIQIILLGVALSMDAFAASITLGITYTDSNKKKNVFIAAVFGVFQGLMPLIGYWIVEAVVAIVGQATGDKAGQIMSTIVSWIAFALLIFIGSKMIIDGVKDIKKPEEEKKEKTFSLKEVLYFGIATSIDALGSGVALHAGLSTDWTIWLHASIIIVITFIISLIGVFLGKQISKLFKGKYELTEVIGGIILLLLAVWIILSHYLGI